MGSIYPKQKKKELQIGIWKHKGQSIADYITGYYFAINLHNYPTIKTITRFKTFKFWSIKLM